MKPSAMSVVSVMERYLDPKACDDLELLATVDEIFAEFEAVKIHILENYRSRTHKRPSALGRLDSIRRRLEDRLHALSDVPPQAHDLVPPRYVPLMLSLEDAFPQSHAALLRITHEPHLLSLERAYRAYKEFIVEPYVTNAHTRLERFRQYVKDRAAEDAREPRLSESAGALLEVVGTLCTEAQLYLRTFRS